jgi:F-type H+-transporting ATPase subunit a
LFSHVWTPGATPIVAVFGIFSFALQVFMTGFEVLVAFLQAYIFTMLTAVYISGATHPEH